MRCISMIGKTLALYEITLQVGKGGMGEVHWARGLVVRRIVAIREPGSTIASMGRLMQNQHCPPPA
jgi:hypothetical protein